MGILAKIFIALVLIFIGWILDLYSLATIGIPDAWKISLRGMFNMTATTAQVQSIAASGNNTPANPVSIPATMPASVAPLPVSTLKTMTYPDMVAPANYNAPSSSQFLGLPNVDKFRIECDVIAPFGDANIALSPIKLQLAGRGYYIINGGWNNTQGSISDSALGGLENFPNALKSLTEPCHLILDVDKVEGSIASSGSGVTAPFKKVFGAAFDKDLNFFAPSTYGTAVTFKNIKVTYMSNTRMVSAIKAYYPSNIGQWLTFCEIQPYDYNGKLITGMTALASSVYPEYYPNNAIDGNNNTAFSSKTNNPGEWFKLSLAGPSVIGSLVIVSRNECCWSYMKGLMVDFLDSTDKVLYTLGPIGHDDGKQTTYAFTF